MAGRMGDSDTPIDASGYAFAIVVSHFNSSITDRLLTGARSCFARHGAEEVDVYAVPGAFELALAARLVAETDLYDAIVCLGCVIRGETPHFEYVSSATAQGIQRASLDAGIPIAFGVLTTDTTEQAEARAGGDVGNKGEEAARTAMEMALFVEALPDPEEAIEIEPS